MMDQSFQQFHFVVKFTIKDDPDCTFNRLSSESYNPNILTRNVLSMNFDRAAKIFEMVFVIPIMYAQEFEVLIESITSFDTIYLDGNDIGHNTVHFDIEKIIRSYTELNYASAASAELHLSGIYK